MKYIFTIFIFIPFFSYAQLQPTLIIEQCKKDLNITKINSYNVKDVSNCLNKKGINTESIYKEQPKTFVYIKNFKNNLEQCNSKLDTEIKNKKIIVNNNLYVKKCMAIKENNNKLVEKIKIEENQLIAKECLTNKNNKEQQQCLVKMGILLPKKTK